MKTKSVLDLEIGDCFFHPKSDEMFRVLRAIVRTYSADDVVIVYANIGNPEGVAAMSMPRDASVRVPDSDPELQARIKAETVKDYAPTCR